MTIKEEYIDICNNNYLPLFFQHWWLNAVCGNDWDVVICKNKKSQVEAVFPFHYRKKFCSKFILPAQLSPYSGLFYLSNKYKNTNHKLSNEKKIINKILSEINEFDFFTVNMHYDINNWLPFYWNKFNQITKYTYLFKEISKPEKLFQNFEYSKQKNIRKASKKFNIVFNQNPEDFYNQHENNLLINNKKISYPYHIFNNIYTITKEKKCSIIISAISKNHNIVASLFIVWDKKVATNLISSINPFFKSTGVGDLLIYEALKYLSDKTIGFDFEGSMIENVERSFRKFNPIQVPYFQIYKFNSYFIRLYNHLKPLI